MTLFYQLSRAILGVFFRLASRYEVHGQENLPAGGPLILAMNHIHMLDSPAAMVAVPWQVKILAAHKWARHPLGLFLRLVGAHFVNRGEVDRRALRWALGVLAEGNVFGIAPEGTRSKTHQLQPARGGVAYLAYASGAPILPVVVTGVERIFPSLLRLRRARVVITIGRVFRLPELDHKPRAEELLELADLVMYRLAELLPPEYRGVYAEVGAEIERTPAPRD
jgi:1-acyl-sn-glycerol-3-phosphate acyltransferase